MMHCDDADQLLAQRAVGALEEGQAEALRGHIDTCETCRAAGSVYQQTADMLPLALSEVEPPPELRQRIMAEVYAKARVSRRPSAVGRLWARVPTGRAFTLGGVGSLALAAVVVAIAVLRSAGGAGTGAPPVEVALSASAGYAGLHGTLEYAPATHDAVLVVDGLPAHPLDAQNGAYQVWMVPKHGAPQPVGCLALTPDGAHWTAGMRVDNLGAYSMVAATVEPLCGGTTPSDRPVFSAQLPAL